MLSDQYPRMITKYIIFLCTLISILALQELTDDTFTSFFTKSTKFCIMFYSPSCGTCRASLPIFRNAAMKIEAENTTSLQIAQIDVSEFTASGDRFDVWHYPTFIIDGVDLPYHQIYKGSPTSAEELAKWIRQLGSPDYLPPVSALWVLDEDSIDDCVEERICLIQFTDSRCVQCLGRAYQIHELANHIYNELHGEGVKVAQVDLAKYPNLGKKYSVELRGAAVRKVFRNGKMYEYNGPDDWEGAVNFIKARLGSPLKEISTMAEYASEFLSGKVYCSAALLLPSNDNITATRDNFLTWAESTRDFCSHFLVTNNVVLESMAVESPKFVIKHSAKTLISSEPPYVEIDVVAEALPIWFAEHFKKHQFSLVNEIDGRRITTELQNLDQYVGIYTENPSWDNVDFKEEIAKIAGKFQYSDIPFFIGDVADVSVTFEEADTINADVPFLFLIRDKNDRIYTPNYKTLEKFGNKSKNQYLTYVTTYISQYLEGKVAPRITSDKDHGVEDGVLDIVGTSVDRVFNRTDKDILLLMTSSNRCRSCPRFEDVLLKFGEKYENSETLTVGLINVETNRLPRKLVMGSSPPHLVLLPAERSGPFDGLVYFYDEVTENKLLKFVTDHGKHDVIEKKYQKQIPRNGQRGNSGLSDKEDVTLEEDPGSFQSMRISVTEEKKDETVNHDNLMVENPEFDKLKEKTEKMLKERFGSSNYMHGSNINPSEHKYDEIFDMEVEWDPEETESMFGRSDSSLGVEQSSIEDRKSADDFGESSGGSVLHDEL